MKQTKQIENDSDDDWVLGLDMDKVNAYNTFENQKSGLDKSLDKKKFRSHPLKNLKK